MQRRDFIAGFGAGVALPFAAWAQQPSNAVPVVGWLDNQSPESSRELLPAFRRGLAEAGYVEAAT